MNPDKIIIAILATILAGAMLYHHQHQTYNPAIIGYWQMHPVTMQLYFVSRCNKKFDKE